MEEGTRTKKTVFVGGVADDVDEAAIYEGFSTFGTRFDLLSRVSPEFNSLTNIIRRYHRGTIAPSEHESESTTW